MKKFKDFLYDNNDILIAFAILVIAALLIVWRMSEIIEYPKAYINENTETESPDKPDNSSGSDGDAAVSDDDKSEAGSKDDGKDNKDNKDEQTDPDKDDGKNPDGNTTELWVNGALSKTVEVSVYGDSASSALQCLIDVGLFKDYAEYQSACDNLGIDHQKVRAGVFSFEKGSTKNDIARAINWS